MAEAKSIKELLELLEGVKLLGVAGKKVFADGKIDMADLPLALGLLQKLSVLSAAVQGADQLVAEVKDLSADEANQLVLKVLELAAAIKAA